MSERPARRSRTRALAGIVGLGAAIAAIGAIWRSRGAAPRPRDAGGRHRQGGKIPVVIPAASNEPEPMIVERGMGEEGAGL